nr:FkbM family methyltransferase [uncultured Agathobaculum sp.]
MDFFKLAPSVWTQLQSETRPIVLYGMGDGADKILDRFDLLGIRASGVFASDAFVRGHSFRGFRVKKLSETVDELGEGIVIVIAFATQRPEVLDMMYALDARFTVVAPDVPVVSGPVFDTDFARAHQDELERAYALLADERSKQVFVDTVRFKLSGRLCYLRESQTDKDEIFRSVLRLIKHEHFADLGAYTGDTIREMLRYTGGAFGSITALEPDQRSFRKLSAWTEQHLVGAVELVQAGAWCKDGAMRFSDQAGRQSHVAAQGRETAVRTLDSVLAGRPCTYLKMDVEGAEREAIYGAAQTIRRCRPKLNIAVYHRSADFFQLPLLIHALCPDYRLYLRHHPYVPAWDTNLYAVCK